MELKDLLKVMIEKDGSDLFLTTGAPPSMKAFGRLMPMTEKSLPPGYTKKIAYSIMSDEQIEEFEHSPEMNLALFEEGIGRFRVNIFQQRNEVGIVARNIKTDIPNFKDLGLPETLTKLMMHKTAWCFLLAVPALVNPPPWPHSSIIGIPIQMVTSLLSRIRWNLCISTRNPSSTSAKLASTLFPTRKR
jgi:Tfp pilus assembly ATPase PilU